MQKPNMHPTLPKGWSRFKLLIAALTLPFILTLAFGSVSLIQVLKAPADITYRQPHTWDSNRIGLQALHDHIKGWGFRDARIRRLELEPLDPAPEQCGAQAVRLVVTVRVIPMSMEGPELLEALTQDAQHAGLGSRCGSLSFSVRHLPTDASVLMPIYALFAVFIVVFVRLSRRGRRPFWVNWANWQPVVKHAAALRQGALFGLLALLGATALGALDHYTGWLGGSPKDYGELANPWLNLVLAVAIAPIVEEFIYRAWLLERLLRVMTASSALFASAAAFAGVHLPGTLFDWLNYLLVGLIFGLLWLQTRSLVGVVVAHALYNAILLAMALLLVA